VRARTKVGNGDVAVVYQQVVALLFNAVISRVGFFIVNNLIYQTVNKRRVQTMTVF
jgi:hypothetical protein